MIRLILTDKILYLIILDQQNILNTVAGDEPILTDHDGQMYPLVLRDRKCLYVIVVHLLIGLRIDLDPAGIPCTHAVRVIRIDIDRT